MRIRLVWLRIATVLCAGIGCAYGQQSCSSHQPMDSPKNFSDRTLTGANFTGQDLTGADFSNSVLQGVSFVQANLTNANFSGVTFDKDASRPSAATDFTLANLTGTCLASAKFNVPTYFAYATLTCATFANTDVSTQAILGPGTVTVNQADLSCRLSFQKSKMSCAFIDSWRYLDLTGADISSCLTGTQLSNRNFTNAKMLDVSFNGADLRGSHFDGADLTTAQLRKTQLDGATFVNGTFIQTKFSDASVTEADFTGAKMYGSVFDRANLTHSVFYGAQLSVNASEHTAYSASFTGAHLKNVNMTNAKIAGALFSNSNFYSTNIVQRNRCLGPTGLETGFTDKCASARNTDLTGANFTSAYLAGLDLSGAKGAGVSFTDAILVGANLGSIQLNSDPNNGRHSLFTGALLQGSFFSGSSGQLTGNVQFTDAFFDFNPNGNSMYILLDGQKHNAFRCSLCDRSDICVRPSYGGSFGVPASADVTCPNGSAGPCGRAVGGLTSPWRSPSDLKNVWYRSDSTFTPASTPGSSCKTTPQPPNQFW